MGIMRKHTALVLLAFSLLTSSNSFRCGEGDTCLLMEDPNNVLMEFRRSAVLCKDELNVSYGVEFEECTIRRMGNVSFPSANMRTHSFRNFTCDEEYDKSPVPLDTMTLEYQPNINEFYINSNGKYRKLAHWKPSPGIETRPFEVLYGMTVRSAKDACDLNDECFAFTILRRNTVATSRKRILLAGTTMLFSLEPFLDTSNEAWFVSVNDTGIVTYVKTQARYEDFIHFTGYIHRGQTLRYMPPRTSLRNILSECDSNRECGGLTFKGDDLSSVQVELKRVENMTQNADMAWHSFIHIRSYGEVDDYMLEKKTYDVDLYRYRPMLIAVVRNFGTKEECEFVKAQTGWEDAKVSNHVNESHIGRVDYRRLAKAKAINQPLFDFASPMSKYYIRNYAIVHGLTGHHVWPAGQEAISLIKYNVSGEEFRPHCDGDCTWCLTSLCHAITRVVCLCHSFISQEENCSNSKMPTLNISRKLISCSNHRYIYTK